ncbi:MAG: ThiF family adenylyltransferase [Oscillospiraceae bacterium]|nr:ThiF family adenylyltransferase [Oscillospiraceae bacterium]
MIKRFALNIGPISKEEQTKLNQSRVFIAGCGGIGGHLIECMNRMGVKHIVCADNDHFEESNLNRQILADLDSIGHSKARCAALRAAKIYPQTQIQALEIYLTPDNLPPLLEGADIAMDALDNIVSRKALFEACSMANIPLVHGAAAGWLAQAAFVSPGNRLYDILYPDKQKSTPGVLPFAAAAAASMQSALAIKYLCGRCLDDIENNLYIFDLQAMEMDTIKF